MACEARPVNADGPGIRVSNAAASAVDGPITASQSRTPRPCASASSVSWVSGLLAASTADARVLGRLIPCTWVGAPTTTTSADCINSALALPTGTTATSGVDRRSPSATASAMVCVFPYIDS